MLSVSQLQAIASAGAGFSIDGSKFSTSQLQSIVASAKPESTIIINNSSHFAVSQLQSIAAASKGNVFFNDL